MAEANTPKEQLYLEENVKIIKELPHDLIRLCCSYQQLNNKFEEKFKLNQTEYQSFQNQSMNDNNNNGGWNINDNQCLKHLENMRKYETEMLMYQDEKIELFDKNIDSLESYINKITKDLNKFEKMLQPNMIKLPFPNKKI
mmetsp:Transcript_40926/g.36109  ORF Transcript_40926/g.36109 Transcript_40926/m.36109 type:complete len:141 (-) Transcript_40926:183-605(-)